MRIERIWEELEAEPASSTGWIARLARPEPEVYGVQVAYLQASKTRALLCPVDGVVLPRRTLWPECAGLDLQLAIVNGRRHLALQLRERATADVFSMVAEDLVARLTPNTGAQAALTMVFNQLARWQLFLMAARDVLGVERQRGLFGELLLIASVIAPRMGWSAAVDCWKGANQAHQDFQFDRGAIEVKTSAAKQPTAVRITSERQLDDTGVGKLFLHVYVLDEREVSGELGSNGESLPGIIARVRAALSADVVAAARFEEKVLLAGWLDQHASRYENRRWKVRSEHTYRVETGFPRIVERELSNGVGDVSYLLNLAACEQFSIPEGAMMDCLA